MSQNNSFLTWAQAVLAQYPLREPKVTFLGHSDNITFRVEEPGGAIYLLRLHQPVLSFWSGIRQLPEFITSELTWLEALAWEGGFPVQHPVHTTAGELVASLKLDGSQPIPATLLTWQAGRHFSPSEPGAVEQVEQYGALAARLHEFSSRWTPPPGFARPSYDADHFRRIFARLLRGVDLRLFSEESYRTLRTTCQTILEVIDSLPVQPDTWGMIHADLHVGNFLVGSAAEQVIPIDFSFCGFGHYLFDLSVCLSGGLKSDLRPAFLRGYRAVRPLPENHLRAVDAYALSSILSYFAYQIENPAEHTWLQRRIAELIQNECRIFLDG